ncbi:MAG: hypothetical protein H0V82_07050 [Candidatus Protochlamydia sp.]|nr:hypothetical protein [Candidatus Protochlamydia sp.]
MEIKGLSQSLFYTVEQNQTKKNNDPLKGMLDNLNKYLAPKMHKEDNFFKISPKEDIYNLECRSVAKNISDLNAPLCDTGLCGGGGGG